jgi:hypothetical protein
MNKHSSLLILTCVLAAGLISCSAAREGAEGHKDAVARVDGHTLTIEHAAHLLSFANENTAPALPLVVDPFADLWIGYTVLISELASPDTFSNLDFGPLIKRGMDQELAWMLREEAILARVQPSDEELRAAYEEEQPYTIVQAYHILVAVPDTASAEEADSLRRFAEALRERALAGEDFEQLAIRYSDDAVTAPNGGALGRVSRGRTYPEIEETVLQMEPGISETVRSGVGYHIFRVTDRVERPFEEVREEYRRVLVDRQLGGLEEAYIDSLFEAADIRYALGAVNMVRRLAFAPQLERLSAAQRNAALVRYNGGALTMGEWADFVVKGSPETRRAFSSDSITVAGFLRELVRNKLLVKAALDLGFAAPEETADSLREVARRELFTAAAVVGIRREHLVSGEQTIPEAVDQALELLLSLQRSPAALESVAPALRKDRAIQVYPDRFPAVIERLKIIREQQASGGMPADAPRPE